MNQATGDTVVIVTFDESGGDNTHGGGAVYWFMMGRAVKQNYQSTGPAVSPNYYTHESSLRLTAELLGLNFSGLGGAATAPSMAEFFAPGVAPNPPTDFKAQVVGNYSAQSTCWLFRDGGANPAHDCDHGTHIRRNCFRYH